MPPDVPSDAFFLATPLGASLRVRIEDDAIVEADFVPQRRATTRRGALQQEIAQQVHAYFARRLACFEVPMRFAGTPLQQRIWHAVSRLAFGELVSYADVARAVGAPRSHRAVAWAMRAAPADLFVPAHRVVGADGRLRGAGTGSLRAALLAHEGFTVAPDGRLAVTASSRR